MMVLDVVDLDYFSILFRKRWKFFGLIYFRRRLCGRGFFDRGSDLMSFGGLVGGCFGFDCLVLVVWKSSCRLWIRKFYCCYFYDCFLKYLNSEFDSVFFCSYYYSFDALAQYYYYDEPRIDCRPSYHYLNLYSDKPSSISLSEAENQLIWFLCPSRQQWILNLLRWWWLSFLRWLTRGSLD